MLNDSIYYEEIQNKSEYVLNDKIRIWYDKKYNELWLDRNSCTRFDAPIYNIYKYVKRFKPTIYICFFNRDFSKMNGSYEYDYKNGVYELSSYDAKGQNVSQIINIINDLLKGSTDYDTKSNQ